MAAGAVALPALPFEGPKPVKRGMIVRSARPEDLEMTMAGFESYITPVEQFFVRTHTYAASVDVASWKLTVNGLVGSPLTLSLDDLKRMTKFELVGVLECAGNGRSFYDPPMPGLQWGHGAVGNGRWAGVRLADVLKKAGLKPSAKHLAFEGADSPPGTMPDFQRSIPIEKAMDVDTLLAYEMNGSALPQQHGYPLRLVVPGWAGDSWVKWVTRIEAREQEAEGFFMKTAYRHPGKGVEPGSSVDPSAMHPVTSLRAKSVIYSLKNSLRPGESTTVRGVSWSGDRGPVSKVEVSTDAGKTWSSARLGREGGKFGWKQWTFGWTPRTTGEYGVMARAYALDGDVQPQSQEWNPSGYLWNVTPEVKVFVGSPIGVGEPTIGRREDWPQGFQQACLTCHESDVIEQQRLTKGQWERELDKMARWGAKMSGDERSRFADYLSRRFGVK